MGHSLIGRAEELSFAENALSGGNGLIVGGAAGVGKTSLAREVASRLDGWYVARTTVTPAAGEIPLGGIAGLGLVDDAVLADRAGLLSRLTARLLEAAGERRALVVVDDAHLLDALSAAFVHQLVVSRSAGVLATVRSGEPLPPEILSLAKDGLLPRLELQPLGLAEFASLVGSLMGGPAESATVRRLWSITEGNVLFLRELIVDARETGRLVEGDLGWRWEPGGPAGPRLVELVAERMGRPAGSRRAMIELLAVGEPLGSAVVERLIPDVDLEEEERKGLITVEESGRRTEVRLAHPLFSEVVRARLPVLARRQIHRTLANTLEEVGGRRQDDLLRLAIWRLESAGESDAALLVAATRRARQVFDPDLAVRLAKARLELGPDFEAELHLGAALRELGRYHEAVGVLDALVGREPDDPATQQLARERAWVAFLTGHERRDTAERLLREAEHRVENPQVRLMARGELALLLAYTGRFADALAVGDPLIEAGVDDRVRLRSLAAVGACLVMAGDYERVLGLCDELEEPARRWREEVPRGVGWVNQMRSNALVLSGRTEEAEALLHRMLDAELAPILGAGDRAYTRTKLGFLRLLQGCPQSALDFLTEAEHTLATHDPNGCRVWCLSLAAEACSLLGRSEQAALLAGKADALRSSGFAVWDGDAARARIWVSVAAGETTRPVGELMTVADEQICRGQPAFAAIALHDAMRLGSTEAACRLERVAGGLDGGLASAMVRHARAVTARDAEGLDAAAEGFAELGFNLWAAEAAARAAEIWGEAGLMARAAAAARSRDSYQARCEIPVSPVAPVHDLTQLSRREKEVVNLAGQGMSNADIAERLVVSVRTVESHLYSAFGKLGVSDRAELASRVKHSNP